MHAWVWSSLALVCVAGCAAQSAAPAEQSVEYSGGDADAPPNLAALPDLPNGASGDTPRTHQGLLIARQTLDAALPEPPGDRSYASLQHWVETDVVAWIAKRRSQTRATRDRFLLEGEPSDSELVVSHAVVGLIDEDTALALARLPAPSELDSEPEIAAMYRDVVRAQAAGFSTSAVMEFRDCANTAYRGPEDMRAWARFCHARFDRLQSEARDQ